MLEAHRATVLALSEAIEALAEVAERIGARGVGAQLRRDTLEKLRAGRFHLVVVGEFNHGKSSFVNALLGHALLPVGVTPTTAAVHHLVHGDALGAVAVYEDGRREPLALDSLRDFAVGGSAAEGAGLRFVEIAVPSELLREGVVLVDTPGVNDLSLTRAEITYDYVPRSDAVLFVLDAGQPMKESERQFLQQQLVARARDKILFVIAKADVWSADERAEALGWVRARLAELLPEPRLFAVSAQAALQGRSGESGIPELTEALSRFLAEERAPIALANAVGSAKSAASLARRGLDARRRAASFDAEQLARRIELLERDLAGHGADVEQRRLAVREEIGAIKAWARRDLDRFVDDLVARLPALLDGQSGDDLRQHLGAFLEHAFAEWARTETQEIAAALETLGERTLALMKDDARAAGERVGETMSGDLSAPQIKVDTFAYDVGVFAVLSAGLFTVFLNALLGGILLAAAPALALYNKGRAEAATRQRALELAPLALREAAARVAPRIDELVDDFARRLDEWVVTTSQELHREIIEVLRGVAAARGTAVADAVAEAQLCDELAAALDERLERVASFQPSP